MSLSDGALTISGQALSPTEDAAVTAALAGLPAGSWTKDVTVLDDGTPAAYSVDYSAASGATIAGKLPKGLDVAKAGPHHTPAFFVDDSGLGLGVSTFCNLVVDYGNLK